MRLTGAARVAGVVGWPVKHSRSPRLHGFWLQKYQIDGAYVPLAVAPNNLAAALRALPALGLAGVNVTVPHKELALTAVDEVDPLARRIGAVNTVVVRPDGSLHGSNTDAFGFIESIRASAPGWAAAKAPAVIIGAGGAARAVIVALLEEGVRTVRVANRTKERAVRLAEEFGVKAYDWGDWKSALDGAGLLVNTTTQGMAGQPALDIDLASLPTGAVVNDIVYVPLETPLLAAARQRGNPVVDGLGMLLHQARPGFRAWFGVDPEVTPELRAHVAAGLG
ncbi:MAG TPA: shikimate dehydrogenase [Alphaproteobacteria bacterium]|nr:shikimate dehydrogenase [Alphaproteobacteria bacterium]